MPSWTRLVVADSVSTFMSGATVTMHVGVICGPRPLSTSTRHMRHMPTELIRLCQQKRGMYSPWRSAAAMISSPLRAVTCRPLSVIDTAFGSGSGSSTAPASATVASAGSVTAASAASAGAADSPGLGRSVIRLRLRRRAATGASTAVTGMRVRGLMRASNSSGNSVSAEWIGAYAEGPTKQIVVIL